MVDGALAFPVEQRRAEGQVAGAGGGGEEGWVRARARLRGESRGIAVGLGMDAELAYATSIAMALWLNLIRLGLAPIRHPVVSESISHAPPLGQRLSSLPRP